MVTGPESTPAEPRAGRGTVGLLGVWGGTFAAGLVTTAVATAAWVRLDYARWPDKAPGLDAPVAVAGVGVAAAVVGGWVVTGLVRRRGPGRAPRLRRWAGAWAVALAAGAVGAWGFAHYRDRANHARTTADLVGTWRVHWEDGTPAWEETFRADGTYEATPLSGPANERATYRGTYLVSADGRHLETREDDSAPAPPANWAWNIEFADRDHFRKWSRVWHYTSTDVYVREQ